MSLVRRYPLAAFFVLACALSWWGWPLYALDLAPTPIAPGPFVAAFIVLAITRGKTGVVELLRRMVRWRVGLQWYAAALGLPIVVTLTAVALNVFVLGAQPSTSAAELGGWSSLIPTFFILLLIPGSGEAACFAPSSDAAAASFDIEATLEDPSEGTGARELLSRT